MNTSATLSLPPRPVGRPPKPVDNSGKPMFLVRDADPVAIAVCEKIMRAQPHDVISLTDKQFNTYRTSVIVLWNGA